MIFGITSTEDIEIQIKISFHEFKDKEIIFQTSWWIGVSEQQEIKADKSQFLHIQFNAR